MVYKCDLHTHFCHKSQNCTSKGIKSLLVTDLCARKIRFTIASPISLYTVFSSAQLMKNWFWGQRTKQMVAQHEVLAGGKGDRCLAKKALSSGCIQTFIPFFGVKIFQGHRDIFCHVLSCNCFMTTWKLPHPNFNDFDRIWQFQFVIMTMTGAQSARYLDVDEVLAVLDGVDISLENWVLTGSSWPTISRAQNLNENNIALLLCNILTL